MAIFETTLGTGLAGRALALKAHFGFLLGMLFTFALGTFSLGPDFFSFLFAFDAMGFLSREASFLNITAHYVWCHRSINRVKYKLLKS